jgi:demethoxyubiquinone hydroxylase (CLK1/Coq7/Cat5 family)
MTKEVENTEVENDQPASFEDALMDNLEVEQPEQVEQAEQVEDVPEYSPLEAPEFFSKEHKEVFSQLQSIEDENAREIARKAAQAWIDRHQEDQKYVTQKSQTLAEEKRQYENQLNEYNQYQQAVSPLNDIWRAQGVAPAMGMAQLAHYGKMLHTDPQALIQEVAQFANIDLNQIVEEQPYIDPHVDKQLRTLQQQNQQLQQTIGGFQQGQTQQQQQAINEQINQFAEAVDDSGQQLHPHFDAVVQDMAMLIQMPNNGIDDLDSAYQKAVLINPDIQKELQIENEKKEAAARQAEAQKAKAASVRTDSKTKDAPKAVKSFEEALMDNLEGLPS